MSHGFGPWGYTPWGGEEASAAPSLLAVSSDVPAPASRTGPAVVDVLGGTVCVVSGSGFSYPAEVRLSTSGIESYLCVVPQPRYDIRENVIYFGTPAVPEGYYHLSVITDGGEALLENVIRALPFADRVKIVQTRSKWGSNWVVGDRIWGS